MSPYFKYWIVSSCNLRMVLSFMSKKADGCRVSQYSVVKAVGSWEAVSKDSCQTFFRAFFSLVVLVRPLAIAKKADRGCCFYHKLQLLLVVMLLQVTTASKQDSPLPMSLHDSNCTYGQIEFCCFQVTIWIAMYHV